MTEEGSHMQAPKKIANAGKEAGKKVLATDTARIDPVVALRSE